MKNGALTIDGVDLAPPAEGRILPPGAYTSPAIFEAEMAAIFERSWVHVADLPDLRAPGDFATASIGRVPVVVLRGEDGEVRGFVNACRHRGATVAEGAGNCGRRLTCPYHGWTYATDGRLVGVPHREEFGPEVDDLGLLPIRVATLGPVVFGSLDPAAPPFEVWAGELVQAARRARADEMEPAFATDFEVEANWKAFVENSVEGYHIASVHDALGDIVVEGSEGEHHYEAHSSYTHAGIRPDFLWLVPPAPHLSEEERCRIRFGLVFPNFIPVLNAGEFSYLRIDPVGPERMRLRGRSFDLGGPVREALEFRRDAFERTNRQDIGAVERLQRGLRARGLPAGIISPGMEGRIAHFERMVCAALADAAARGLRASEERRAAC